MLAEIIAHKRRELAQQQEDVPLVALVRRAEGAAQPRDFAGALRRTNRVRLLAEIKRASPSRGAIRTDLSPADMARTYEHAGADALSVLTDTRYFLGSDEHLEQARRAVVLPCLRKDFTLSEYHVFQARAANADAVLLMTQVLDRETLTRLLRLTEDLGMTALVEGHEPDEIRTAVDVGARLIGINNRDLWTLHVDLATTERLRPLIPDRCLVVSQSGMETAADVRRMVETGVDAVQIGSALMTGKDMAAKVRELRQGLTPTGR